MCFDSVSLNGKIVDEVTVFEGYKIFQRTGDKLYNFNTAKIQYNTNAWHEAKLNGDSKAGRISKEYLHGFHFFATENDAKSFMEKGGHTGSWFEIVKTNFKDIVSSGFHYGVISYCAKYMMIPKEIVPKLSNLKVGDRFIFDGASGNTEFVFTAPVCRNIITTCDKFTYFGVQTSQLYSTNEDKEVTLIK